MTISSVQAPSSLSILPSHHSSATTVSTDSNSSLPRLLTPSTVTKAIYNQLSSERPPPSSFVSKQLSSRVRQQRKFGEIVTSDSFLDEIKQKTDKKMAKSKTRKLDVVEKKTTSRKQKKKKLTKTELT